jgi:uncharacterized protein YcbX
VRLASIHIYPMKAARAVDLDESFVEPWGLAGDRRWLLVDEDGRFISQREEPSLARVVVTCGPGGIHVSADGRTALAIAEPQAGATLAKVTVWSSTLLAADGETPVPMTRFRPSVVVAGAPPWAEDGWRRICIGAVPFRVAKPCGRCVVTTIDQLTGDRGRQPLMMLGQRRRFGQELVFGQNLIPDSGGVIRIGDPVEILDAA